MSRNRTLLLAAGIALMLGVGVWALIHRSGPTYQGKNFNHWFRQYYTHLPYQQNDLETQELRQEALDAIKGMGTNAVPSLLRECFSTYQDTVARSNVFRLSRELPEPFKTEPFVPADDVREAAAEVLVQVKPPARLMLPAISNAFASTNLFFRRVGAELLGALSETGTAAIPLFRQALTNSDSTVQFIALRCYSGVHNSLPELAPDVVNLATNLPPGRGSPFYILMMTLSAMGPQAADALPWLKSRYASETNYATRLRLAGTMVSLDTNQWPVFEPMLAEVRTNWASGYRNEVVMALANAGPSARPAVPFLLEALRQLKGTDQWMAINALVKVQAQPGLVLPVLEEEFRQAKDERDKNRPVNLAIQMLRFDPTNKIAIEYLGQTALSDLPLNYWSFQSLCQSNVTARTAKTFLIAGSTNSNQAIRKTAERALARLRNEVDAHVQ